MERTLSWMNPGIISHVLDFLSGNEVLKLSLVCKDFLDGARLSLKKLRISGGAFGELESSYRSVYSIHSENFHCKVPGPLQPLLLTKLGLFRNLRRLELVAVRIFESDFRNSLQVVSRTLLDLRIEMIRVTKDPANASAGLIVMEALRRLDLSPPTSDVFSGVSFPKLMRLSSYRKMLEDKCSNCNSPRPSSKCGACKFYAFCSKECQQSNWSNESSGHSRVCKSGDEIEFPRTIAMLIENVSNGGQLKELDLAHYWHSNMLFPSQGNLADEEDDEEDIHPVYGVNPPIFTRPNVVILVANLVTLRLIRCGVDNNAIALIAKNSKHLKALDISLNTKVRGNALDSLAMVAETLTDLRLRQNYRLTDEAIALAIPMLSRLEFLDLRCGIRRLRRNQLPNRTFPNLKLLWTPTQATLKKIGRACLFLKVIKLVAFGRPAPIAAEEQAIPELSHAAVIMDDTLTLDDEDWGGEASYN